MFSVNVQTQQLDKKRPEIWAIGGGKGGVGKSLISILLSLELARRNQKVVLVDADLGGANLHTLMGIKTPARTLNDFITKKYRHMNDICIPASAPNLELICGASEILTLANPQYAQKNKITQGIASLSADYVIMDLGAGTSYNVLDFFLIAQKAIVVLTPQPISIQNAYAFIRNTIYRRLSRMVSQKPSLLEMIKLAMDPRNESRMRTVRDLYEAVRKAFGIKMAESLINSIGHLKPLLITNLARDERDTNAGKIVKMVAEKYLTIQAREVGAIAYDPIMEKKISQMVPVSDLEANCPACLSIRRIVDNLTTDI